MLSVGLLDGLLRFYTLSGQQKYKERRLVPHPAPSSSGQQASAAPGYSAFGGCARSSSMGRASSSGGAGGASNGGSPRKSSGLKGLSGLRVLDGLKSLTGAHASKGTAGGSRPPGRPSSAAGVQESSWHDPDGEDTAAARDSFNSGEGEAAVLAVNKGSWGDALRISWDS